MNKQEAIEKIKNIETLNIKDRVADEGVDMVIKNQVIDLISQIDELQKVTVPKFVAEWLEETKQDERPLYSVMSSLMNKTNHEWTVWKSANMNFSEIMAQAWIYGYKVEKEKLYRVEIPNPNNECSMNALIRLPSSGKIALVALHKPNTSYLKNKEYQLTESEIKQDFEWAWQWAKEVE